MQESRQSLAVLGLNQATIDYIKSPDSASIDRDLEWLDQPGHRVITLQDPEYPACLKEITAPPPLLFLIGDHSLLSTPQLAIVGSRNPSSSGKETAREFAAALSGAGLSITSGLALGIDASAHEGCLKVRGKTIAVVGTGPDRVYPARHKQLALKIAESGCLVSEFSPGTGAKASNFPRRNRIISGLSLGVLVIEAAIQSGSLITARLALEQGREVFAIPGSIHNPLARGCNALIKTGAKLVETAVDVLEELRNFQATEITFNYPSGPSIEPEPEQKNILKYVAYSPTSIDTLVKETGESAETIASSLLVLELQGYVQLTSGGCYCRIR
ncbi:MAG: DNA-processing protein DprA [Methylococcaceae bacterium]|nr:DNA-processing protein DprA [Methylococcaceae bacterium]MCI0666611.1 DNA-processing protein DprA [Methylococcaceae bacterium]MCI0734020.1 DNA-processing protein DprA [Methylococcaceae bacterium]